MKPAIVIACCLALVAPRSASLVGGPATATDAQAQLSNLLAASQRSLMLAEKHQKRAMKKTKKNLTQLISTESNVLAAALVQYGESLSVAVGALQQAANSTKASLSLMGQNSSGSGDESSFVEESARLSAKAMAAEQKALHLARERSRALHEGARRAMEPLEDCSDPLSRKLGDLSGILDKAQEVLNSAADQADAKNAANPAGRGTPATFLSLKRTLEEAKAAADAQVAAADKRFSSLLAEVGAKVSADTAELERNLEETMQSEVLKLRHPDAAAVGAAPNVERLRGSKPAIVKRH